MKNIFDILLIIFISFTVMICMFLFTEEVAVQQKTVHIRNKVIEIIEINGGYTEDAKIEADNIISNIKDKVDIIVSKEGKLNFGEKIIVEVVLKHIRALPFNYSTKTVYYRSAGEYYNINVD
ncbi:MAG TPA: hypothetical protein PLT65_00770 [Bacilli bacterium]|nr:hypothetical protein [Bacilli bacterium]